MCLVGYGAGTRCYVAGFGLGLFGECAVDSYGARGSKRALPDFFLFCFLLGGVWADDALLYLSVAHGASHGTAKLEWIR